MESLPELPLFQGYSSTTLVYFTPLHLGLYPLITDLKQFAFFLWKKKTQQVSEQAWVISLHYSLISAPSH